METFATQIKSYSMTDLYQLCVNVTHLSEYCPINNNSNLHSLEQPPVCFPMVLFCFLERLNLGWPEEKRPKINKGMA